MKWNEVPDSYMVVGSLLTSSNTVSLSLLPDTFYVVEIHDLWTRKVSPPTIVNTTIRQQSKVVFWELVIVLGAMALSILTFGGILLQMRITKQFKPNTTNENTNTVYAACNKEIAEEEDLSSPMVGSQINTPETTT